MGRMISHSENETFREGYDLGQKLRAGDLLCFFGDLGAGKTTFIKGVVAACTEVDGNAVVSPTYTYLNIYEGALPVYHFDLYRLKGVDDFLGLGFDEFFQREGVCCIEWSERIEALLIMPQVIKIEISHYGENLRQITTKGDLLEDRI